MNRLAFFVLVAAGTWAQTPDQTPGQAPELSVEGLRHIWYVVPTGGDFALTAGPWKLVAGAGVEQPHFGRDTDTGDVRPDSDPYTKPLVSGGDLGLYYRWPMEWFDVWAGPQVFGYRVLEDSAAAFPDWKGNVFWALEAGLKRDKRQWNDHGLESGYLAQTTAEWSPSVLSLAGTDFYRASARVTWFLPLWDEPGENQVFSGLVALRADAQYTGGSQVPLVRLDPTEVRGYDATFDARFLTAGSAELRVRLPSWWKRRDVVPVGFGFVDVGSYSGFADVATDSGRSGLLAGVGVGGGLELFGKATPTLTLGIPLTGEIKLWWDLSFQLAF